MLGVVEAMGGAAVAAGVPPQQRRQVILIGIMAALVLRVIFALLVTQLMQIVGLVFAGGLLLLWVSWKMYRELHPAGAEGQSPGSPEISGDEDSGIRPAKSFVGAAWAVALADVSMRSEEHTSELQSLMRISYAVFCLKKKKTHNTMHK